MIEPRTRGRRGRSGAGGEVAGASISEETCEGLACSVGLAEWAIKPSKPDGAVDIFSVALSVCISML